MNPQLVAYYRVSTDKQGESGLGLEAQRASVEAFARALGSRITATYTEVESGKLSSRPELAKAIAHARRGKARLVIAKLDRLARNVAFVSSLMDSGVDFVCVDNPHANRLTIHILAAVAEDEARRISERTKSALAALKARGVKLGSARVGHWAGRESARALGAANGLPAARAARTRKAIAAVSDLLPIMQTMRRDGSTLKAIANHLNNEGHRTSRGCDWTAMGVKLAIERMD